jgi:hypothetical protein
MTDNPGIDFSAGVQIGMFRLLEEERVDENHEEK